MTRPSRRSRTGSTSLRRAATALVAIAALSQAGSADAQSLKLRSLRFPPQDLVGTWVSYHGRSQSRGSPVREFEQRIAVVSKQDLGDGKWGLWIELKTTEPNGTARIERGFYAPASMRGKDLLPGGDGSSLPADGEGAAAAPPSDRTSTTPAPDAAEPGDAGDFVLLRYQVLTPGGKLFEYPVGTSRYSRASGDVSSFELFEYDPTVKPVATLVGPDTLRLGRRIVPTIVERVQRNGTDRWPMVGEDGREAHLVLTQIFWRNGVVPLTGYARSLFRADVLPFAPDSASSDSTSAARDSAGAAIEPEGAPPPARAEAAFSDPDSVATAVPLPDADAGASRDAGTSGTAAIAPRDPFAGLSASPLAWTELTLVDLGADARPEVDQEPELAPDFQEPETDPSAFQR